MECRFLQGNSRDILQINMTNEFESPRHFFMCVYGSILKRILTIPVDPKGVPLCESVLEFFQKHSKSFLDCLTDLLKHVASEFSNNPMWDLFGGGIGNRQRENVDPGQLQVL